MVVLCSIPPPRFKQPGTIYPGLLVDIVLKKDQPTGKLTRGVVGRLLTNKQYHPRGIKVMLQDGQVGRVQHIVDINSEPIDDLV